MARLHLLRDIEIVNAERRQTAYMIADGGNLFVRILPSKDNDKRAGKDWWFRYEAAGKKVKLALGSYGDVSLKEARDKAAEQRKLLGSGVDPRDKRNEDKAKRIAEALEPKAVHTVAEAFEEWKTKRLAARKDGGKEVVRMFTKDVLGIVGALPLKSLRRRHIVSILDTVHARGAKRMVGQLLTELRLFVTFAIKRDWIEADVTAALSASEWDGQTKPRTRVLADEEITELADKLAKCGIKKSTKAAIWIMLSTMCRVGALEAARWADINFEKRTWRAARKSREEGEYTIFLSTFAADQFRLIKAEQEALVQRKRDRREAVDERCYQWVFPAKNPRHGDVPTHVTKKTLSKQIYSYQIDEQLKNRPPANGALQLKGGPWSAHDLRRTGSTIMARVSSDTRS